MTSTKPKSAPAAGNAGSQTGAAPGAGAPKSEPSKPEASKSDAPKSEAGKPEASRPATSSASPSSPSSPGVAKASPGAPASGPALDVTSLEQRLKETRAIGVFTKLSLKNQVDDLLGQLKAFHNRKSSAPLSELRQRYDLLLLKVLSLLQDGDPPLASAISSSREAIWGILADPQKFARL